MSQPRNFELEHTKSWQIFRVMVLSRRKSGCSLFIQCDIKGMNMEYNPDYADENYSYQYGGYVDSKQRGGFGGGRGRRFGGRPPRSGFGGRCVSL